MSSASTAALTCLGLTFLNPHVYLDTVVLLGAIGAQQGADGRWWFGAGAISASILWFTALGFGSRRLSGVLSRPGAWRVLDGGIAVIMATMAVCSSAEIPLPVVRTHPISGVAVSSDPHY